MSIDMKAIWQDKYQEYIDNGLDDQEAIDKADDYCTDYMADYGDYLYEQKKDRRLENE